MTPLESFEEFYKKDFLPAIPQLKKAANTADSMAFAGAGFILVAIFLFIVSPGIFSGYSGIIILLALVAAIIAFYKYAKRRDAFDYRYKDLVVKKIIDKIIPGSVYKPDGYLSHKDYKASGLFRYYYDDYTGDDFISGVYNNVPFRCSGLETRYENNAIIFRGFFYVFNISSMIRGGTYVWCSDFEQLPVSMMDDYRMMPLPHVHRVPVNGKVFNDYFSVCSTLPSEAGWLLSTERLSQMIRLREAIQSPVVFSFVAGHCYVAAGSSEDLLEPGDFNPEEKEQLMKSYLVIYLIPEIINSLALHQLA